MNILILGGTQFLGRHFVEYALREGHQVTLFNRGITNSTLYPQVEYLRGDRLEGNLIALQGRTWDLVIDTLGYVPDLDQIVRSTATLLRDAVGFYVFISSISVYSKFQAQGDEHLPLYGDPDAPLEEGSLYGTYKARAEAVVREVYGNRSLIVRPGLIVGPYDNTGRFTYWVRRIAQGNEVLAPEHPELLVQLIDARDLVTWVYGMAARYQGGTYNAVGPDYTLTLGHVLSTCQQVTGSNAQLTWIPGSFLVDQGVEYWQELPLWLPTAMQHAFAALSNHKAIRAGLKFRPLVETINDLWQWDQVYQSPYPSGLARAKEATILQAWSSCH